MSRLMIVLCAGLSLSVASCGTTPSSSSPASSSSGGSLAALAASKDTAQADALLAKFLRVRAPGSATIAPDGTMYVSDRPDGIVQLYRVKDRAGVARADGAMTKLTSFPDGIGGFTLSPDARTLLVSAGVGGNENNQIYMVDQSGPKPDVRPLTQNPKVQYAVNQWTYDSSGFYFSGNDESPNDFYLYRYDLKSGSKTKILGQEGSWSVGDCTVDNTRVLVSRYFSASDSKVYELSPSSGDIKEVTLTPGGGGTASNDVVGYMPDEKSVLILADTENGIKRLYRRDLATGKVVKPIPALDAFEIDEATINMERTLLGVVTNVDGFGDFTLYRLPGFEKVELPPIEKGVVGGVRIRGNRVLWSQSNAKTPGLTFEFMVPDAGAPKAAARQVTFADTQGLDFSSFPLPELVKYKAFDGREIPAFLWLPPGYIRNGIIAAKPIPFIVNYHGGPEGQSRPGFSATIQFALSQGFGVMQPNVRGSSGYGREFLMLDDYKGRWDSVRDGVDAADWLVKNGYATPGKIATYGGSYGGFMSVACLVEDQLRVDSGTQKQRLFGAGINVVGIVNLKTFLEQTSGYRRKLREVEYGPLTDPDFLHSVSSIHKIDKINVPMFIAHGLNDPRVPIGEAMQLAVGLRKRGLQPLEFYCPDEGHGFAKLSNRLLFSERMVKFLDRTIGK